MWTQESYWPPCSKSVEGEGVPTLAGGHLPWWRGVPTLAGGTYLGQDRVPPLVNRLKTLPAPPPILRIRSVKNQYQPRYELLHAVLLLWIKWRILIWTKSICVKVHDTKYLEWLPVQQQRRFPLLFMISNHILQILVPCGNDNPEVVHPNQPIRLRHNYRNNQNCTWTYMTPNNQPVCGTSSVDSAGSRIFKKQGANYKSGDTNILFGKDSQKP